MYSSANRVALPPKETLEVFSDGRVLRMVNFRETLGYGFRGFSKFKTARQDKGHGTEVAAFVDLLKRGGASLIALEDLLNTTRASFAAVDMARQGNVAVLRSPSP